MSPAKTPGGDGSEGPKALSSSERLAAEIFLKSGLGETVIRHLWVAIQNALTSAPPLEGLL